VLDWYGRFADGRAGRLVVEATGIRDVPSGRCCASATTASCRGCARSSTWCARRSGRPDALFIQLIDFLSIRRRPEREVLRAFLAVTAITATPCAALAPARDAPTRRAVRARSPRCDDDGSCARARRRASSRTLRFGYRERVTDLHLPHVARAAAGAARLFADAAARAREPASTASSCTTRTPTRWRRSCRRGTTCATTATAARAGRGCGCRSR
jgi:hypothetical protein